MGSVDINELEFQIYDLNRLGRRITLFLLSFLVFFLASATRLAKHDLVYWFVALLSVVFIVFVVRELVNLAKFGWLTSLVFLVVVPICLSLIWLPAENRLRGVVLVGLVPVYGFAVALRFAVVRWVSGPSSKLKWMKLRDGDL